MTGNDLLFEKLKLLECPDSTYRPLRNNLVLKKAKGSLVYDADGKEYIDLCAGFGVLPFGHNPDYVLDLLLSYSGEIPPVMHGLGDVYPSEDKIIFLSELFAVLPGHLKKAALALTGSQAVEVALKTAMMATGRKRFLAFEGSYHGLDLGVLPVTSGKNFKVPFAEYLREDNSTYLGFGCDPGEIETLLKVSAGSKNAIAGVIVEPVQGRGGVRPASVEWLQSLREVCNRYGALLIFDEIFTGFGRTGQISRSAQVPADLVCFGKALGGGFPLSVCVGTAAVMNAWPECVAEALHTGTFFGHPMSCRISAATIVKLSSGDTISQSQKKGDAFRKLLRAELQGISEVVDIRGEGMMTGIEFRGDGSAAQLMEELRQSGIIVIPSGPKGNVLSITPALNIDVKHLVKASTLIKEAATHLR